MKYVDELSGFNLEDQIEFRGIIYKLLSLIKTEKSTRLSM